MQRLQNYGTQHSKKEGTFVASRLEILCRQLQEGKFWEGFLMRLHEESSRQKEGSCYFSVCNVTLSFLVLSLLTE